MNFSYSTSGKPEMSQSPSGGALVRRQHNNSKIATKSGQKNLFMFDHLVSEHDWVAPDNQDISVAEEFAPETVACTKCGITMSVWNLTRAECCMKIALVGTSHCTASEAVAIRAKMKSVLEQYSPTKDIVISGGALGTDSIAKSLAMEMGFRFEDDKYKPKTNDTNGFRARNMLIAADCHVIYSFTTTTKNQKCYHCHADHQRTGGCWTYWLAPATKRKEVIVVPAEKTPVEFFNATPRK